MINSEFPNDPEILARVGAITSQLLKDLPNASEHRGQTILERALRHAAETEQRIANQLERIAELENLSFTDPMTVLHNRRGF
jgi:PleD family two-component response regulator